MSCCIKTESCSNGEKCPECQLESKSVSSHIVSHFTQGNLDINDVEEYHACLSQDCDVLYYSTQPIKVIKYAEAVRKVYPKTIEGDTYLCHCFKHSIDDFNTEGSSFKDSDIVKDIQRKIKEKQCRCESMNPLGKCCLGTISTYYKSISSLGENTKL